MLSQFEKQLQSYKPNLIMHRKTQQHLLPYKKTSYSNKGYDIYPSFPIKPDTIHLGFKQLSKWVARHSKIIFEGYTGVDWEFIIATIQSHLGQDGFSVYCYDISAFYKTEKELEEMLAPYTGGSDPVFGNRFSGNIADFFELEKLNDFNPDTTTGIHILYGAGASLSDRNAPIVYFDLPKNEIQYRARAGKVTNLGYEATFPPKEMYKRFYFIDWPVLNALKKELLPEINILVDCQFEEEITWMTGAHLHQALEMISGKPFRVRPWFEPGARGRQWIKKRIEGLNKSVVNYAWSFELITPENGIILESSDYLLEVSFDFLMYHSAQKVLGKAYPRFQNEFPIRFDFLDTFDGGNLSVQVHPKTAYIKEHFGENFTQDETYYILDCEKDAQVYLGFQENIDPTAFRNALEESVDKGQKLDIEQYVQQHAAQKHDLFLIPSGTIHCSGKNNMVLEISSTPYIFTFKLYDWRRLDLDGKPRPINIERGFENLDFTIKGDQVKENFISNEISLTLQNAARI